MVSRRIVKDMVDPERTTFSIEVFPPKTSSEKGADIRDHLKSIFDTVEYLMKHDLEFVSVTYNPENKTRATSIPVAAMIQERFDITAVPHLTCMNSTRSDLDLTLNVLEYFGLRSTG